MSGKLIVLEGLDGCGKATQAARLYENLTARGLRAHKLSFPCYDEESSALVRLYLGGAFGVHPDDVNGYASSVFFGVDRYASYKAHWEKDYRNGDVFVCDRYTTSNAVFQTNKLPEEQWDGFLDWLYDFEYNKLGIPRPDLVVLLDLSPETGSALMRKRYAGDENKKDIHERDLVYQEKCRRAARYCAEHQGWRTVRCDDAGGLRAIDDIAADVLRLTWEVLK
ncbi:MAG: thymidylate kinase [Oscillospiraceae bacterium]|nr:thymidylate kinase [Oscillospiraceae bacterium]